MPIDQPTTNSDVITLDHRYSGLIMTGGRRLADVLSDPNLDMVEMHDAAVRNADGEPVDVHFKQVLVAKKDILMVIPPSRYEAPIRRHNNYQLKSPYLVKVVLPRYILSAVAHLPQRANPWMLIDNSAGLPTFFGLTDVTMHTSPKGLVPARCDTVIVHRPRIEAAELAQRKSPTPQPEEVAVTPEFGA